MPHHVTQRGNRRQETFFCDDDYQAYLDLIAEWCGEHQVAVWAYCLMANHVHLIVVPKTAPSESRWSSAAAHIKRKDDCLVKVAPLLATTISRNA